MNRVFEASGRDKLLDWVIIMKRKLNALSRRYGTALQKHLGPSRLVGSSLEAAQGLGRQAVAMGLETLDMARIHEQALITFNGWMRTARAQRSKARGQKKAGSDRLSSVRRRARAFFAEAINPIEETHLTAREARVHLGEVSEALGRRTVELAAANRSLKQGIARRRMVEKALKASGGRSRKLLRESDRLQKHLRHLIHQILSANEDKRKDGSHKLKDEIAQTLLAINIRLLSLKEEASRNAKGLQKDIASTRRLVDKSMKSIKRFACEFGKHHET